MMNDEVEQPMSLYSLLHFTFGVRCWIFTVIWAAEYQMSNAEWWMTKWNN